MLLHHLHANKKCRELTVKISTELQRDVQNELDQEDADIARQLAAEGYGRYKTRRPVQRASGPLTRLAVLARIRKRGPCCAAIEMS